jgi:hypothetical protein
MGVPRGPPQGRPRGPAEKQVEMAWWKSLLVLVLAGLVCSCGSSGDEEDAGIEVPTEADDDVQDIFEDADLPDGFEDTRGDVEDEAADVRMDVEDEDAGTEDEASVSEDVSVSDEATDGDTTEEAEASCPGGATCDDGDPCTTDWCDTVTGGCRTAPLDADGDGIPAADGFRHPVRRHGLRRRGPERGSGHARPAG